MDSRSVPCWAGICRSGIGTSIRMLGMIIGMTPNIAYLARRSATRASAGHAGKGNPLQLDWFMRQVRSSPVTVTVELEPLSPGAMWLFVTTPSISTLATPLTVATRTTRMNIPGTAPVSVIRTCVAVFLSTLKVSWNPLVPTSSTVTSASARASITALGTDTGMNGPIIRLSWTLLSIGRARDPLRHRDGDRGAGGLHELVRADGAVCVAQDPEEQRVAEVGCGQQVRPVARLDRVRGQRRVVRAPGLRDEALGQIGDGLPARGLVRERARAVVPAVRRERDRRDRSHVDEGLEGIVHGVPPSPSAVIATFTALDARFSLLAR